jgi:Heterokaryon incompatibility protein (HET)
MLVRVGTSSLFITYNLASALKHLRYEERSRVLWVDAICLCLDQYQTKYRGNLRLGPLVSEGFRFALFLNTIIPSRLLHVYKTHSSNGTRPIRNDGREMGQYSSPRLVIWVSLLIPERTLYTTCILRHNYLSQS